MRFHLLACDYDGTLALHGRVDQPTVEALNRFLATGRKLVMVTGRELDELLGIFPQVGLFEYIVAENGALLYRPSTKEKKHFGEPPSDLFIDGLRARGVGPISVGNVIVATWHPHETAVLEVIQAMGLEMQVIFNKGAVMILPANINKASGLRGALIELGMSPHEVVGVGDAENDHAFLSLCECSVAVSNALPSVKERVDIVTQKDHGGGVIELIDQIIANDLEDMNGRLARHHLLLGTRPDGADVRISPYGINVLIAGPSGSGKSTTCMSLIERFHDASYQFCVIDPEGDYEAVPGTIALGNAQAVPPVDEVLQVLKDPSSNVIVNLIGLPLADRPPFFLALLPRLQEMRARIGRPHWVVVDEAHHLLPSSWVPGQTAVPRELKRLVFVTVHPDQIAPWALETVDLILAVGKGPEQTLSCFAKALGGVAPQASGIELNDGEVLAWPRSGDQETFAVKPVPTRTERRRHTRKYAQGELPPDRSFYFRGPESKLNLRAQNLIVFLQLAEGVDDETWLHHLRKGDYSRWFRERIKNDELAEEAAAVESRTDLPASESRARIKAAVEANYTLPASATLPMPGTDADPAGAG